MNTLTVCLVICVLAVISYVWGKISMATTAMISMAAFVITGCLSPEEALANFGTGDEIDGRVSGNRQKIQRSALQGVSRRGSKSNHLILFLLLLKMRKQSSLTPRNRLKHGMRRLPPSSRVLMQIELFRKISGLQQ